MAEYIELVSAIEIASGYCHPANIADELAKLPRVEVRHGRWEKWEVSAPSGDYTLYQCSVCAALNDLPPHYCPNCGARMDGEEPTAGGKGGTGYMEKGIIYGIPDVMDGGAEDGEL